MSKFDHFYSVNRTSTFGAWHFFTLAVFGVLATTTASGTDLWVDRNSIGGQCDNGRHRSQVTKTTPWCTMTPSGASVQPGDVVHVREGVYGEANWCVGCTRLAVVETTISGTPSAPIKFMAEPGETVVLTGENGTKRGIQISPWTNGDTPKYIEFEGFIVRDFIEVGVNIVETEGIVVRNIEVSGCSLGAVGARYSRDITIEGCKIHDNHMSGWTSAISLLRDVGDLVVRNNRIWSNTDEDYRESEGHGIILDYCEYSDSILVENNVIWGNEGWCMNLFHSVNGTVRNNTCFQNGLGRPGAGEITVRGQNFSIHNNILVSRAGAVAMRINDDGDVASVTSDYNLLWSPDHTIVAGWPPYYNDTLAVYQASNNMGWDAHSVQIDPKFINPFNAGFQLLSSSPAIDLGGNEYAPTTDAVGASRPFDGNQDGLSTVDLGAYEYMVGGIFFSSFEEGIPTGWTVIGN